MSNHWNQWEGQIVDGRFPLLRYLGGSEQSAVFATQVQEKDRLINAAIRLVAATPESGERRLARWQQSSELSHPNLIPLYDSGWAELRGARYVYLVMESAEENVSQVLPTRALDAAEARQILEALLDVLAYLHSKGFVHGGVKPSNIMASGDQLKISNDSLQRVGELLDPQTASPAYAAPENAPDRSSGVQPLAPASDVWSLGVTLVETLTQTSPLARASDPRDPSIPRTLPEPFLDIARHCLVRDPLQRWSISQISDRLHGRASLQPIRAAATQTPVPAATSVPAATPVPAAATLPPRPPVARKSRPSARKNKYAVPFAIGFALVFAALLVAPKVLHHSARVPETPAVAEVTPAATPAAIPSKSGAEKPKAKSAAANLADEEPAAKSPSAVPALIHPETIREEATNTIARSAAGAPAHGQVAHRSMPEVLQSATRSIRGTVKVSVKVNVDRAGNVEDAELASRGPSKYFARAALEAAQQWTFRPPQVGGRGVLSTWILQFEFTRDGTNVVALQELP
jgi:serine/threonine-protein kinase